MRIEKGQLISLEDGELVIEHFFEETKHHVFALAEWKGHPVLAHFFFGRWGAFKKAAREREGLSWLRECGIFVPFCQGTFRLKNGAVNVYDYAEETTTFLDRMAHASHERLAYLKKIVIELATHHVFGVVQKIPYPHHFFVSGEKIMLTHGENIIRKKMLLSKRFSLQHLARFFSLMKLNDAETCRILLNEYSEARGLNLKERDIRFVLRRV